MKKSKILIVEDESIIAENLRYILNDLNYEVIGIASKYSIAIELIKAQLPDIVLIDIILGGSKGGIDLAHEINLKYKIPFIFSTSHSDPLTVKKAKEAKPNGYLLKPFSKANIFTTIEMALAGSQNSINQRYANTLAQLSEREIDVYNVLLKGKTDQEISDQLFISLHTVKSHVKNILIKLSVKNRLEAVTLVNN
jgi:DNA-binding NarL/FixJ family response regulator